jgi:hypothetical protein
MMFSRGQRVHVEFDAIIETPSFNATEYRVKSVDSDKTSWIPKKYLTKIDPEGWPPQIGDIWCVGQNNVEYVITGNGHKGVLTPMTTMCAASYTTNEEAWDEFKIFNPVLVRRR